MVAASGVIIVVSVDHGPAGWAVTCVAALALVLTKLNPLLVVSAGGAVGLAFGGV